MQKGANISAENISNLTRNSRSPFPDCGGYEEYIPGLSEFEPARVQVFRIVNTELDPLDLDSNFYFFSEDCYLVRYSYPYHKRRNNLLYLWQGVDSPLISRRSARSLARALDHRLHGRTTQVRIVQGHEPSHFRRLLRGNMVVYSGNRGAKLFNGPETFDTDGTRLFHIRSSCLGDGQAIQVAALASSLNSEEAFILETPHAGYLWYGQHASLLERQVTKTISLILSPHKKIIVIEEGSEYPEFWAGLGGRLTYPHNYLHNRAIVVPHRIYHCVLVHDSLTLDEIDTFDQHELLDDDVSIVDSGDNVYVWIGSHATELEKELAIERAQEILDRYYDGRSEEAVVVAVRRGYEPPSLVKLFPTWKDDIWPVLDSNPDEELADEIDLDAETISKISINDMELSSGVPSTISSSTFLSSSVPTYSSEFKDTFTDVKINSNDNKYFNNSYSGINVGSNRDIEELENSKPDENTSEEIEISDVDDGFGGFNFEDKSNKNDGSFGNKNKNTDGSFSFEDKDSTSFENKDSSDFSFEDKSKSEASFENKNKNEGGFSFGNTDDKSKVYNFSVSTLHNFDSYYN